MRFVNRFLKYGFYAYMFSRVLGEVVLELVLYTLWLPFYRETGLYLYHYFGRTPYFFMYRFFAERQAQQPQFSESDKKQWLYGPTFLSSLNYILYRSKIPKGACLYDLGCGPGRGCFFMAKKWKSKNMGNTIDNL